MAFKTTSLFPISQLLYAATFTNNFIDKLKKSESRPAKHEQIRKSGIQHILTIGKAFRFSIFLLLITFHAHAQTQTKLGIGLIMNLDNNDCISFDVYQFFVDNPIVVNNAPIQVMLVDDPYQTDLTVTGTYRSGMIRNQYYKSKENLDSLEVTISEFKIWKNKEIVQILRDTSFSELAYDLKALKKGRSTTNA